MAAARGRRILRRMRAALGAACLTIPLAPAAPAVLIDSGDGTGNTSAPPNDPGWDWVGRRGGFTAVYLGAGWVLTANHVPQGDVVIDGITYAMIGSTAVRLDNGDGSFADLKVVGLAGVPPLPPLPVRATPPAPDEPVVMIGNGRDRGAATAPCDPNGLPPPGPLGGYEWLPTRTLRWGTNEVEDLFAFDDMDNLAPGTEIFTTSFDQGATAHEAQGTTGDSGGAAFIADGAQWELAGILIAIDFYPACQPSDPLNTSLYTNQTYIADLSFYRDQIEDIVALPEPDSSLGLGAGAGLLAWLGRRRRR